MHEFLPSKAGPVNPTNKFGLALQCKKNRSHTNPTIRKSTLLKCHMHHVAESDTHGVMEPNKLPYACIMYPGRTLMGSWNLINCHHLYHVPGLDPHGVMDGPFQHYGFPLSGAKLFIASLMYLPYD